MRTSRLLPLLTAGAVVVGGATAVLAEVGMPGGEVVAADESTEVVSPTSPTEDTPAEDSSDDGVDDGVDGPLDEVPSGGAEALPAEDPPDEEAYELFAEDAELEELESVEDDEFDRQEAGPEGEAGANAEAFSAWVSSFDGTLDDGTQCHRGQTIAAVARQGPESFTVFDEDDCVRLDQDHPGNRPANAGSPEHPGADGRPPHAGIPGPPEHAGAEGRPDDAGPPHAGQPGPPPHSDAPEGAGPHPHAGPPGGEVPPGRTGNGPPGPPPHAGPSS